MTHPPIDLSWDKVKKQGISIGTIVTAIAAYGYMFYWLDANFVSEVQGDHIKEKVEDNRMLITEHITEFRIANALGSVRQLENAAYQIMKEEERNGSSTALEARKKQVDDDLTIAKEYKTCIINNRPNCVYLKK